MQPRALLQSLRLVAAAALATAAGSAPADAATASVGGTVSVTITATVASTLPTTTKAVCSVGAVATGANNTSASEQASVAARISGTTLSCTVRVPYLFVLDTTGATLSLVYSVTAIDTAQPLAFQQAYPLAASRQQIGTIPLPANGATTSRTVTLRI